MLVKTSLTNKQSDANNFTDQVQRNAISTTNLAIIVATSVSGAVILTSIIVCVFLRYRRKRREARGRGSPTLDEKGYDKPIAVRGSVRGSRFNPFNGGNYPLDKLKLPSFNTRSARKDEPLNFGFALSDYSDLKEKPTIDGESQERVIVENSASTFRLQRPPSVKSVEAIRVIRVNSRKEKEQPFSMPGLEIQPAPTLQQIKDSGAVSEAGGSQSQFTRKPVTETSDPSLQSTESDRKSLASTLPDEGQHESKRFTTISGGGDKNRSSSRYTMISTASFEPPSANNNNNKHYTVAFQSEADEALSWRPPSSRGNSRANSVKFGNTAQRLAFRDSGDPIPEPDATGWKQPKGGFSMVSVSSLMRSDSANMDNRQPTIPKLPTVPRQGPSFAAFPTVRNGTPGVANRPRPALAGSIREDAAERRTEKGKERATQPNGNVDGGS